MRAPICEVCLKSDALCEECGKKLSENEISETDVRVSRYIYKLEKTMFISDIHLVKTHELDGFIVLIVDGSIGSLIGKSGRIIKMMSSDLGKRIRILAKGDVRKMVQDLVSPARVFGINVLYSPKGEEYTVVIPQVDKRKIFMDDGTLKKALSILFNKEVSVKFS